MLISEYYVNSEKQTYPSYSGKIDTSLSVNSETYINSKGALIYINTTCNGSNMFEIKEFCFALIYVGNNLRSANKNVSTSYINNSLQAKTCNKYLNVTNLNFTYETRFYTSLSHSNPDIQLIWNFTIPIYTRNGTTSWISAPNGYYSFLKGFFAGSSTGLSGCNISPHFRYFYVQNNNDIKNFNGKNLVKIFSVNEIRCLLEQNSMIIEQFRRSYI